MRNILYALSGLLLAGGPLRAAPLTGPGPDGRTLEFIPNQGQWPKEIRYSAAVPGGHLYLEPNGLRYVLLEPIAHPHEGQSRHPTTPDAADAVRGHQVRVRFVGADTGAALLPAETTGEVRNYLQGSDPAAWVSGVPSYRQLRYQAAWPGVGVAFYENQHQQLEYDFEVAAGADPARVQLRYEGASTLSLDPAGRLHVGTTLGELTELSPAAYQADPATGRRRAVACHYQLDAATHTVSFRLGRYDHGRPLVIDPTVQFSTYTGASGDNWGFTAAYDAAGNMYSGGIVLDNGSGLPSFPTTAGAFQTTFGAIVDIALIKYNTSVNGPASRVWATYLGGNSHDYPSSLVVNANNELLLLGTTASTNYPTTTGAAQRSFAGGTLADPFNDGSNNSFYNITRGTDIVVSRLSSTGGALLASTYLGGSGTDGLTPYNASSPGSHLPQNYGDPFRGDILTDAAGNVYIASVTASSNFPTTAGSFGVSFRGGTCDAVVAKLSPALGLVWSGYLGGTAADAAYSVQRDAAGNVYVTGGTRSSNLLATAGAANPTWGGGVDGYVARIAADGSAVQRTSYLGTSAYDQAFFVQVGADGGVYVLGQTLGNWLVTNNVYSNPNSRQFIVKLNGDLTQLLQSTVIGSGRATLDFSPTAFLVDQCDRVYVSGWGGNVNRSGGLDPYSNTTSFNGYTHGLPVTANAVRGTPDTPNGGSDFYLAQLSPGMASLYYGTFFGNPGNGSTGDHVDGGTSRFDPRGVAYSAVCSCTNTNGFPVPPGAYTYSATNNSFNCNNAAFKLNFEPTVATVSAVAGVCVNGGAVPLTGSPAGGTWTGPGVSQVGGSYVFTPSQSLLGTQTLTYTVVSQVASCTVSAQTSVTVSPLPTATVTAFPAVCQNGGSVPLTGGSPAGGVWSGPGVSQVGSGYVYTPGSQSTGPVTLTYTVRGTGACANSTAQATTTLLVTPVQTAVVPPDTALCPGSLTPFRLRGTPAGGTWTGAGVSGSVAAGFTFVPNGQNGTVTLTYTVGLGQQCQSQATRRVAQTAQAALVPKLVPGPCTPSNVAPYQVHYTQDPAVLPAGATLTWDFGDGTQGTGSDVTHSYLAAGTYQPRLTVSYNQGRCSMLAALPEVKVRGMFIPNIITPGSGTQNAVFQPSIGGCPPRLQIFSRWGRLVYEDPAYQLTWNADGLAAGLYYYLLTPTDGSPAQKGWVEVVK